MHARLVVFLLAVLLLPAWAAAQQAPRAFVITVGNGDLPYERFGHNALLFIDPVTGQSVAYDWGRFDFDQPGFLWRFVQGQMLYSAGRDDGDDLLHHYIHVLGRRVVAQELNLTPDQSRALLEACEVGYRPENRDYRYDYFIANCSTRLRDVLDEVLGGEIRGQLEGVPSGTTFRREAERYMAPDWPLWLGVHAALGVPTDREIDAWEQGFLPVELKRWLREVEVTAGDGRAPLVGREVVMSEGTLPPVALEPPSRWWQTALLGLALAGGMVLLAMPRRRSGGIGGVEAGVSRSGMTGWLARGLAAGWFFVAGFGGAFALWVWGFTEHWGGYANQNALLLSPLGLPLAVMVVSRRWERATRWLAAAHLLLCGIGVLLFVAPGLGQENSAVVALAVPANIGAAWVAGLRPRSRAERGGLRQTDGALPDAIGAGVG